MGRPVTEKVNFNVNVRTVERDGRWIAMTLETGVITVGETEQKARDSAARWNTFLIREAKHNGVRSLTAYLNARGIRWQLESDGGANNISGFEAQRNAPLAAILDTSGKVELAA